MLPVRTFFLILSLLCCTALHAKEDWQEGTPYVEEKSLEHQESSKIFTYGAEDLFCSRYVWRGINYSRGAVMQPSGWLAAYDFNFNIWTNYVLNNEAYQGNFDEIDYTLTYTKTIKNLSLSPAIAIYAYPHTGTPVYAEFLLSASYPVSIVKVYTNQAVSIKGAGGAYYGEFGVIYEKNIYQNLSLSLLLGFGIASSKFNDYNIVDAAGIGWDHTAIDLVTFNVGVKYYPVDHFYLRPHITYSSFVQGSLRDFASNSGHFADNLFTGIAVGFDVN